MTTMTLSCSIGCALGIPFDMLVMLVGSIALGLIISDTIRFIRNFKRYYITNNSAANAIERILLSTEQAITITSVILTVGFSVYFFAFMRNIVILSRQTEKRRDALFWRILNAYFVR
jgi:predicted RND superfamily exporter protein